MGLSIRRTKQTPCRQQKQLTLRFITKVCRILSTANLYTTTYRPRTNGQTKWFIRILTTTPRHYLSEHQRTWNVFTDAITYAYSTEPHSSPSFAPFKLEMAHPQPTVALKARLAIIRKHSFRHWYLQREQLLSALMNTADREAQNAHSRHNLHFNFRLRRTADNESPCDSVLIENTFADQLHKLAPVNNSSFPVVAIDLHTLSIQRADNLAKNIFRNCVANTTSPQTNPSSEHPLALRDSSRVLDLPFIAIFALLFLADLLLGGQLLATCLLILTSRLRRRTMWIVLCLAPR